MRVRILILLGLALLAGAAVASADCSDLSNGVFIAHAPSTLQYSSDPPGGSWCAAYSACAIDSCSEQDNEIDSQGMAVWYVLCAWTESKEWCGAEFGLGDYDEEAFVIEAHGPCFPSAGLTIPTSGWPGPNEGIALTTTNTPWSGNFQPVYWFAGYVYAADVIPLSVDSASGLGGWARCADQEEFQAAGLGGMGLLGQGTHACPEGGGADSPEQPPQDELDGLEALNLEGVTAVGRGVLMYGALQWVQTDSVLYLFGQPLYGSNRPSDLAGPVDPHIESFWSVKEQAYANASQARSREEFVVRFLETVEPYIGGVVVSCKEGNSSIILTMAPPSPGTSSMPQAIRIPTEYPIRPRANSPQQTIVSATCNQLTDVCNDLHTRGVVLFFGDSYLTTVPPAAWPRTAMVMRALLEADAQTEVDVEDTPFMFPAVRADWLSAQGREEE